MMPCMSPPNPPERPAERRQAGGAARSGRPETAAPGVLERLPRTRPQRPSARRAAARRAAAVSAEPAASAAPQRDSKTPSPRRGRTDKTPPTRTPRAAKAPKAPPNAPRAAKTPKTPPKFAEPPAPPQGFEAEEQIEPGRPVQPPSGSEVAAAVVELLGETAQAGLSAGGRLVKDTLRRLAGS